MALEVKGDSAGQFINDASSGSAGQSIDRTASSGAEATPIPSEKKTQKEAQAVTRTLSSGVAQFGHSSAPGGLASVNTQMATGPSVKTVPVLQLANASPSGAHAPARQSAVARQAQKIISDVENEIQNFVSNNPVDAILNPGFALIALNKAYQSTTSEPLKRALLADPRVPQLLDGVVNTASYSGEIPGCDPAEGIQYDPFANLEFMLKDENIDPALRRALLSAAVKEGSKAIGALRNLLPFEDDKNAFGKFIEKKHFKELPAEIRFSILIHIQLQHGGVIEAFALLVDKAWFRQPQAESRKLALSDQHLFVELISEATWDGNVKDTLDLLGPQGPELRWEDLTDVSARYGGGVIRLKRPGPEPKAMEKIALDILPHEFSHAKHKDDLTPSDSELRFGREIIAYIEGFKKHHKRMPNQEEVFSIISNNFLRDGIGYSDMMNAFDAGTAEGRKIAERIGELIGLKNPTSDDIRKFDSAFREGQEHLSQLPLSPEAVDNWLSGRAPPFDYEAFKSIF